MFKIFIPYHLDGIQAVHPSLLDKHTIEGKIASWFQHYSRNINNEDARMRERSGSESDNAEDSSR